LRNFIRGSCTRMTPILGEEYCYQTRTALSREASPERAELAKKADINGPKETITRIETKVGNQSRKENPKAIKPREETRRTKRANPVSPALSGE
jgi:hypothetical protein